MKKGKITPVRALPSVALESPHVRALETQMIQIGLPSPLKEYRFHDARKWRFDLAWPLHWLAVECDGATWAGGRHTSGSGFQKDCEKMNEAVILGWRVLRVTSGQIRSGEALKWIERALAPRALK